MEGERGKKGVEGRFQLTSQPVNVSRMWTGRPRWSASVRRGTISRFCVRESQRENRSKRKPRPRLPSLRTLYPRPVGLLGRTSTSMDRIRSAFRWCSSCSARNEKQLNSSEPQNRILNGSEALEAVLYGARRGIHVLRSRTGRVSRRSAILQLTVHRLENTWQCLHRCISKESQILYYP